MASLPTRSWGPCFRAEHAHAAQRFEAAANRLQGYTIGFADSTNTSAKKGETLVDTIRMVEQYAHVIVMRHPREGAARLASQGAAVPIINGGDGANQHPTQTFLDLYTIETLFPQAFHAQSDKPLRVALAGDLRYGRTVHSLITALCHFPVHFILSPVQGLELPQQYIDKVTAAGLNYEIIPNLQDVVCTSDVLYMTRLQQERFPDPLEFDHVAGAYRIDAKMLKSAPDHLRIMHPLPRVREIASDVDDTQHAHYFRQAGNGVPVRQALLALVLGLREPGDAA